MDIEISDIAHGLARVARWNGQTIGEHAFSVAQHSLVVEEIVVHLQPGIDAKWRLAALLHDAPEYVIGDMISPFKGALGVSYRDFEDRLETAIHVRFGLPAKMPAPIKALIKQGDRACAYFEAIELAGFSAAEALALFGAPLAGFTPSVAPLSTAQAQERYLHRFEVLSEAAGYMPTPNAAFDTE